MEERERNAFVQLNKQKKTHRRKQQKKPFRNKKKKKLFATNMTRIIIVNDLYIQCAFSCRNDKFFKRE